MNKMPYYKRRAREMLEQWGAWRPIYLDEYNSIQGGSMEQSIPSTNKDGDILANKYDRFVRKWRDEIFIEERFRRMLPIQKKVVLDKFTLVVNHKRATPTQIANKNLIPPKLAIEIIKNAKEWMAVEIQRRNAKSGYELNINAKLAEKLIRKEFERFQILT